MEAVLGGVWDGNALIPAARTSLWSPDCRSPWDKRKTAGMEQHFLVGKHQLGQQKLVVSSCILVNILLINH